jgi:hypothetical protein
MIDQSICVEPLEVLVCIHENSTPVGGKFEFVFGTLEISVLAVGFLHIDGAFS